MDQIFIAPNRGEQTANILNKTSNGGYLLLELIPYLNEADLAILNGQTEVFLWGNKPHSKSKWEMIRRLDWILFYSNRSINSYSRIIHKVHNPNLAEALWGYNFGKNGHEELWEYLFFFKAPIKTNIPFRLLSEFAHYSQDYIVQGLIKYREAGVSEIERQFNSIFNFLNYDSQIAKFDINTFKSNLSESGLFFADSKINSFIASLLTKPFVILTGLSGSGKTKLAQAFVYWICQHNSQYCIVPVGADWTNREPLLGYPNALKPEEYVKPDNGVLDLIFNAIKTPDQPHFLILDEMNLSHVERYFADFLSAMESQEEISLHANLPVQNGVPARLKLPPNLFIIGTVNIDETTNMFSPKVLDRANTIEFRVTREEMANFLNHIKDIKMESLEKKGASMAKSFMDLARNKSFSNPDNESINSTLILFFGELKKSGAEFGYRSATEMLRLIHQLSVLDSDLKPNQKLDIAIMQKLLPKLHGSRRKLCPVLETLGSFCLSADLKIIKDVFDKPDFNFDSPDVKYPLSLEKISRMYRGAIDNGFASFAEA